MTATDPVTLVPTADTTDRIYRSELERTFFSIEPRTGEVAYRTGVDSFVLANNELLYQLNLVEEYVTQYAEELGIPDWTAALSNGSQMAWVPMLQDGEVNGMMGFAVFDDQLIFRPFLRSYYEQLADLPYGDVQVPLSIIQYFDSGSFSFGSDDEVDQRSCPPPPCGIMNFPLEGEPLVHDACVCSGQPSLPYCCGEDAGGSAPEPDGGAAEAGWGVDWITWLRLLENWLGSNPLHGGGTIGDTGGGASGTAPGKVRLMRNLSNEQVVLDWLLDYLNIQIGEDGANMDILHLLASNPQIANPLYLYLNGYYDNTTPQASVAEDLINLLLTYGPGAGTQLNLDQDHIEHILVFEPGLINAIANFLVNHPDDPLAGQVVLAFLELQMCPYDGPPSCGTDYPNDFAMIYDMLDGFSGEDRMFLLENSDVLWETYVFLAENPDDELAEAYVDFLLEEKDELEDLGMTILNPFEEYANNLAILESATVPVQTEIENGIEILDSYLYGFPGVPTGTPLGGSSPNPHGGPDLEFGTDGDLSILTSDNQFKASLPPNVQERRMKWLFFVATFFDAAGDAVADDYLAQFHENEVVFDHYNETLSTMVMNSTKMRNWLKSYGARLNEVLISTGGDINEVDAFEIDRTSLNETYALTILINDTQKINVFSLDSYNFNSETGEWDCYFVINVIDHFGLDDGDVIEFQDYTPGGNGFIAWWTLQHRYGWAPFRTDIWFVVRLGGQI